MEDSKKMAIIGSPDTALPFQSIGLDGYSAIDSAAAEVALNEAITKGYGIIYIEEAFAKNFYDRIIALNKEYKDVSLIIIPGSKGGSHFAVEKIRGLVMRAIGIDIFSEK